MDEILSYRDLDVWKYGRTLVKHVYEFTEAFPSKENYSLTSQMRRASISIPSNIAEGRARKSTREYIQFISVAIGSLAELDTQLFLVEDLGYITSEKSGAARIEINRLQKMLYSLRNALNKRAA